MKKFSKLILESNEFDDLLHDMRDHGFEIKISDSKNTISGIRLKGAGDSISNIIMDYEELVSRLQDQNGLVRGEFKFNTKSVSFEIVVILIEDDYCINFSVDGEELTLKPISYSIDAVWKDINNTGATEIQDRVDRLQVHALTINLMDTMGNLFFMTWCSATYVPKPGERNIMQRKYLIFNEVNTKLTFGKMNTRRDQDSTDVKINLQNCTKICHQVLSRRLKEGNSRGEGFLLFKRDITPEKLVK